MSTVPPVLRQPTPTDVELLAVAACRFRTKVCGSQGSFLPCIAMQRFGPMAEAQLAALQAHHRLIASPASRRSARGVQL